MNTCRSGGDIRGVEAAAQFLFSADLTFGLKAFGEDFVGAWVGRGDNLVSKQTNTNISRIQRDSPVWNSMPLSQESQHLDVTAQFKLAADSSANGSGHC